MQRRRRRRHLRIGVRMALCGIGLALVSVACRALLPLAAPSAPPANLLMLLPCVGTTHAAEALAASAQAAYNPMLKVYNAQNGKLETQTLEAYVLCVVTGEVPASFGDEAIKAQAVAARTLAAYKMRALGGKGCSKHPEADVCTDSGHCQAYAANTDNARLGALAAATAGEVITYGGKPIQVFYHSTSGGQTEDVQNVFSAQLPYLISVPSAGEEASPRFSGEVTVPRKRFIQKINDAHPKARLKDATLEASVTIAKRNASGRVAMVTLGSDSATGIEMRKLFGLNSANFTIQVTARQVVFRTIGFGHGVGMSQVGANAMAASGVDYRAILAHYYTDTTLQRLAP